MVASERSLQNILADRMPISAKSLREPLRGGQKGRSSRRAKVRKASNGRPSARHHPLFPVVPRPCPSRSLGAGPRASSLSLHLQGLRLRRRRHQFQLCPSGTTPRTGAAPLLPQAKPRHPSPRGLGRGGARGPQRLCGIRQCDLAARGRNHLRPVRSRHRTGCRLSRSRPHLRWHSL